jgi:biotin carboxyl carrier protein
MDERLRYGGLSFEVEVRRSSEGKATVRIQDDKHDVVNITRQGDQLSFELSGRSYAFDVFATPDEVWLAGPMGTRRFELVLESAADSSFEDALRSKMPGVVLQIVAEPGATVHVGEPLLILEAMKMEHQVVAPSAGTVRGYPVTAGQRVMPGDLLVDFEPDAEV